MILSNKSKRKTIEEKAECNLFCEITPCHFCNYKADKVLWMIYIRFWEDIHHNKNATCLIPSRALSAPYLLWESTWQNWHKSRKCIPPQFTGRVRNIILTLTEKTVSRDPPEFPKWIIAHPDYCSSWWQVKKAHFSSDHLIERWLLEMTVGGVYNALDAVDWNKWHWGVLITHRSTSTTTKGSFILQRKVAQISDRKTSKAQKSKRLYFIMAVKFKHTASMSFRWGATIYSRLYFWYFWLIWIRKTGFYIKTWKGNPDNFNVCH